MLSEPYPIELSLRARASADKRRHKNDYNMFAREVQVGSRQAAMTFQEDPQALGMPGETKERACDANGSVGLLLCKILC